MTKNYAAPWSSNLLFMSTLGSAVLLATAILMSRSGYKLTLIPFALIFGAALFSVRGYTVTPDAVLVHRLFWTTRLPLAGLQSARFEPDVMTGGLRIFGNGGLFSFSGWFRNRTLGTYRAFVTDSRRTVVLRFRTSTVVVSPFPPEGFLEDITSATKLQNEGE